MSECVITLPSSISMNSSSDNNSSSNNNSVNMNLVASDSNAVGLSSSVDDGGGGGGGGVGAFPVLDRKRPDKEKKIGHRRVDQTGQVTYKKIETSQICGSIQLGISYAVGSLASKKERDLLMQDFAIVETTTFNGSGSNITPAHHYSDFKFKTYAPVAFRYFRELFGIQPEDFLLSVCNEPMRELSNPGASGSVFYITADDEFIIKTVQHKEAEFLQTLLPGYYMVSDGDSCSFLLSSLNIQNTLILHVNFSLFLSYQIFHSYVCVCASYIY